MAVFDREMHYIAASERWLTEHQLDRSPVGRCHYDVFPKLPKAWLAVHRRCLAGGSESSSGQPVQHPDGTVRWIKWAAAPWRDGEGNIAGLILTSEDVTVRKRADDEAAYLASVVASSTDAIIVKALNSVVTRWNPGATRLLGYRADEMIGRSVTHIIPSQRLDEEERIIRRLSAGETIENFETKRITKDGSVLDVCLTVSPIRNALGVCMGGSKTMRDITERRRSEEALRQSEERLRLGLKGAQAGAWQLDIATGKATWTPEAHALHGFDPNAGGLSYEEWLAKVHPEDRATANSAVRDVLKDVRLK